ncbi:hypothetical protein I79_023272 [Cricetulus griseus]|uniref:Uncharacterized protein n=1 Tax=Cricetulus griseus TaxID=10029 RepID=G3IHI2_CRIGR|nr:hypothetical protein I79_023272 [Cricetulus griseus]
MPYTPSLCEPLLLLSCYFHGTSEQPRAESQPVTNVPVRHREETKQSLPVLLRPSAITLVSGSQQDSPCEQNNKTGGKN